MIGVTITRAEYKSLLQDIIGSTSPMYEVTLGNVARVAIGNAAGWVLLTLTDILAEDEFIATVPHAKKVTALVVL